jgi:hypothetical protein
MDLNTEEDMSKIILFITVIALAAVIIILSLSSVFTNAFAATSSDEAGSKSEEKEKPKQKKSASDLSSLSEHEVKQLKEHLSIHADAPCVFGIGGPCSREENHKSSSNNNDKIDKINNKLHCSSSDIDNIPVIPPMNFANSTNGTTTTATATVTIPVCNGIVCGPCLDQNTGQIIP